MKATQLLVGVWVSSRGFDTGRRVALGAQGPRDGRVGCGGLPERTRRAGSARHSSDRGCTGPVRLLGECGCPLLMPTLPALRGPSRPQHVFHRGGVSLPEAATVSLPFLSDLPASQRAGQGFGPSLWRALLGQDGARLPLRLPSQLPAVPGELGRSRSGVQPSAADRPLPEGRSLDLKDPLSPEPT